MTTRIVPGGRPGHPPRVVVTTTPQGVRRGRAFAHADKVMEAQDRWTDPLS
ncbi:hypothetical protein Nocox_27875 [Nonomuraea coxensis DSM 45129]|uniref:Uncharacterized protein n=1 Tax=Nonomuraea coxensis DSM 45129 TaxID=1122611 RepID=A0ABX8U929_9ACTN|nr:hypothetical protein [Nonomuraea coxensis]QYC43167.1 hypothetical protein Nocox_27875 [Nonomuraea coxensis DSM 45129]